MKQQLVKMALQINTPVLFLVFNRPDTTQRVFDVIKKVKPTQLFIAADGPRESKPEDKAKCLATRNIAKQVDWECNVQTLYRERNVGCRVAISSGIDWFFENVDEGIILEDDCLPSKSFFWFCQELLEKYRDNKQVMQINGNFYLDGLMEFKESYYFSTLNACWGWATWKEAWKHFNSKMPGYFDFKKENGIDGYFRNKEISYWMKSYLDEAAMPSCNIWSTQWAYAIIKNNGLSVTPAVNLVQNIGFMGDGTSGDHESFEAYMDFDAEEIYKIIHPVEIIHDKGADALQFDTIIKKTDPRLSDIKRFSILRFMKHIVPMSVKSVLKSTFYKR